MAEKAKEVLSGKKSKKGSKGKKKVHRMHIRRAHGGFVAEHEFEPQEGGLGTPQTPNEEHILPNAQALQDHVGEHFGEEQQPEAEAPAQGPQPPPQGM